MDLLETTAHKKEQDTSKERGGVSRHQQARCKTAASWSSRSVGKAGQAEQQQPQQPLQLPVAPQTLVSLIPPLFMQFMLPVPKSMI